MCPTTASYDTPTQPSTDSLVATHSRRQESTLTVFQHDKMQQGLLSGTLKPERKRESPYGFPDALSLQRQDADLSGSTRRAAREGGSQEHPNNFSKRVRSVPDADTRTKRELRENSPPSTRGVYTRSRATVVVYIYRSPASPYTQPAGWKIRVPTASSMPTVNIQQRAAGAISC